MWRTFIQRSAFHRMNSISSAEMRAAGHRRGAVVFLDAWIDDQAALTKSFVMGVPDRALGAGCTASRRTSARIPGWRRSTHAIVGIADDQAAHDQHAVLVQDVDGSHRGIRAKSRLMPAVLRSRFQKREVLVEDVLDAEKHVAESRLAHQRRQRLPVRRD